MQAFIAEQVHDRRGLCRTRTAKRQQRESARIDAALDRHLPDRIGLVPVRDLDDAAGELLDAHIAGQPCCERRDAAARALDIERNAAADQRRWNPPQHEIGVGDGRLTAAVRIAHRSGLGAGAARADLEMTFAADPGDRTAAGADGLDVDHRDPHRKRTDRSAIGDLRLAAFDQAKIGRGAAGIQRHQIRKARDLGDDGRAERAGRRARERRGDRLAHHLIGAGDAAARLHHQKRLVLQAGAKFLMHALEIAFHMRLDEGIHQRRHRALIFAIFRQHHAGQ